MSNRVGRGATCMALLVGAVLVGVAPSGAQGTKPAAGEVGITSDEIRVAVVADVENPLSPGQFQSQVDAMQGYAKYANTRGGVAGRKLVVDFIDSRLNPDESRTQRSRPAVTTSRWSAPPPCS